MGVCLHIEQVAELGIVFFNRTALAGMEPQVQIAEDSFGGRARELLISVEVFRDHVALIQVFKQPVLEHDLVIFLAFRAVEIAAAGAAEGAEDVQQPHRNRPS